MRDIEQTGLDKQDKWNPLVVSLVLYLIFLLVILAHPGVNHVPSYLPGKVLRQCECAHDEAVGVHHMRGYGPVVRVAILDTGDIGAVAHILHRCDKDTAQQKDDSCD